MSNEVLVWIVSSLLLVPVSWAVPRKYSGFLIGLISLVSLGFISPLGATWLLVSSVATYWVSVQDQFKYRRILLLVIGVFVVAVFLTARELHWLSMAGIAYFTLRNLSVILDSWMLRNKPSSWRDMFAYQFFMPVIAVGPINRYENFSRSWRMRRFDALQVATGAERALAGLFVAVVLGTWMAGKAESLLSGMWGVNEGFLKIWSLSAFGWVQLYLVFSGLSALAIGVALMMGICLEENFKKPYAAKTLMDFWTRWHVSLSEWCRDYVYQPVAVASRSRFFGLVAAMGAIGLWHESSVYYLLWALWHVLGIVLNRYWIRMINDRIPSTLMASGRVFGPLWVFAWLSLAEPVIRSFILGL